MDGCDAFREFSAHNSLSSQRQERPEVIFYGLAASCHQRRRTSLLRQRHPELRVRPPFLTTLLPSRDVDWESHVPTQESLDLVDRC